MWNYISFIDFSNGVIAKNDLIYENVICIIEIIHKALNDSLYPNCNKLN